MPGAPVCTPPRCRAPCATIEAGRRQAIARALRDDPRIRPTQRLQIKAAATALGYRANPLVAALMSARRARRGHSYKATLGYITKYPAGRAAVFERDFGQLLVGARERAGDQGYQIEEFNLEAANLTPRRANEILAHRGIHGLVIAPLHSVRVPIDLDWDRFGAVAVGFSLGGVSICRVAHNHFSGLMLAVQHCRALGYRRPGLVLPSRVHEKVEKRWVAAALLDQSEHASEDGVPPLLLAEGDENGFAAWFQLHHPDVILGVHLDDVRRRLEQLGARIPGDVAFVHLDRRSFDRGFAGIDQDYARVGRNAVDLVIGMLHRNERGPPPEPPIVLCDGAWVGGRSLPRRSAANAGITAPARPKPRPTRAPAPA